MGLVARHLEANGIATVVLGCARDIVEHCGVPRFVFSDFPLGNPCGRPFDVAMQRSILGLALDLLAAAPAPRTTVQTPFIWSDDPSWKRDYLNLDAGVEPAPRREGVTRAPGAGGAAAEAGREVVVYSTPLCAPCEEMKAHLRARGVPFTVRDLLADEAAAATLRQRRIFAAPALSVGGEFLEGFDPERIDRLLGV